MIRLLVTFGLLAWCSVLSAAGAPVVWPEAVNLSADQPRQQLLVTVGNEDWTPRAIYSSFDPAIVEVPLGKGRLVVLTTGWQPDDSQLAVSSKFVPLLWSLLELGGGISTAPAQWLVGDKASLPEGAADKEIAFTQPGMIEVKAGERTVRFAVNLDSNESRTAPLGADELEKLGVPVSQPAVKATPTGDSKVVLQGIEAESRQKLWRWFIAATLAVLLVESALAGWTARKENSKQTETAT